MGLGGQRQVSGALPRVRHLTHCTGGWMGPSAGLDGCGKYHPYRDSIPGPSSPQRVAIPAHVQSELTRIGCHV